MILSFGGKSPRDEGAAFVADNATVQGDVLLKPGTTVWYGAVLRGDSGTLTIGENTNIQDNAVLHCDAGGKVLLGRNVTVGHCALVHGCTVGDDSLIGMHATLLNHSVVGKRCIIGAGAHGHPGRFRGRGHPRPGHQEDYPGAAGAQPRQRRKLCGRGQGARRGAKSTNLKNRVRSRQNDRAGAYMLVSLLRKWKIPTM